MINHNRKSVLEQLEELRQLEEAAQLQFDKAKEVLLRIKKNIRELQKLRKPPVN